MSNAHLILPGYTPAPDTARDGEQVQVSSRETVVGPDGRLYELRIEGTAEVTRGPLGRFLDLRHQIRDVEGLAIPSELNDVLDKLAEIPAEETTWLDPRSVPAPARRPAR